MVSFQGVTSFVQEGGPVRDEEDVEVPAPPSDSVATSAVSLFTWRNAILGGVGAFALLGFVGTGWILFVGGIGSGPGTGEMLQQTTIAVLPFQNNSPDEENAYFADGVHEDILTQLSKIADLTVISRTSVMRYRGSSQSNLRQIGEELGATAILEGSVRRVGNQIRVTTQLIDVRTDAHLWAEAYDRELENVFAVQSEIAQRVAEALQARLTPQVIARIARAPTMSLQAYDIVIRAREARLRLTEEANDEAIRLYNLALELDPEYTEALAGLANAYVNRPFRYRGDAAWLDTALVLAERAIQLDSGEAAGHNALGFVYGTKRLERQALEEFRRAVELNPSHVIAANNLGYTYSRVGRLDEAIEWLERAVRLDPTQSLARDNLAGVYATIGDTTRAIRLKREALTLEDPEGRRGINMRVRLAEWEDGDWDRALEIREEVVQRNPTSADFRVSAASTAFRARDFERVVEHMVEARRLSPDRTFVLLFHGAAMIRTDQESEGRDLIRRLMERYRAEIAEGDDTFIVWQNLTYVHAVLGEIEEALDAFEMAFDLGARNLGAYETNPASDSLRSEPRFQVVTERMREDLAGQRARVEARQGRP